jgi:hypothetical protein
MIENSNISNLSKDSGVGETIITEKNQLISRKFFLKGKTIGVSVSESDNLSELGYSVTHMKDAIIEISRYILALGGKLAYGGDMRQGGFTELFFDLLAYYKADNELKPHERFQSYLAYPISTRLTLEREAELSHIVTFKKIAPPEDLHIQDNKDFLQPDSPENLYIWARCLTKMREEMEKVCDARVFIGGRSSAFKGMCPGILEELLIALNSKNPVYLVGSYGGITKEIIDALSGIKSNVFTNEYHFENSNYQKMFDLYNTRNPDNPIDYKKYFMTLQSFGLMQVAKNNGLSQQDNLRLTTTPHISEIVYLILKGLTKRFAN